MKLFHRIFGEENKQPLIIMHGLFGTSDNWNTLAKKYAEKFNTITIDLRNHGQSPHSDEWTYKVMSEDVVELINDLGYSSAHVMGHSMGGKVAMFMAKYHPTIIDKLIVSDIAPRYYPPHHQEFLAALKGLDLENTTTRKDAEIYMESMIQDAGIRQFLLKSLYWKDEKLAWRFNLNVIDEKIESIGEELINDFQFENETLFVRGSKSNYITNEDMESIITIFKNCRFETVEGAGHWVHAEKPMEYLELTSQFLQK